MNRIYRQGLGRATLQVILLLLPLLAQAASPVDELQLRPLERPLAPIWSIDVDKDERFLVASQIGGDAVLFGLKQDTDPVPIILPIRITEPRRGLGIAISPEGDQIALAAPRDESGTFSVFVVDRMTMVARKLVSGLHAEVHALRFAFVPEQNRSILVGALGRGGVAERALC